MATIKTQKALLLPAAGGQYAVGEAPIPRPGPKEVLVKIIAAALNPVDWKVAFPPYSDLIAEYPFIAGTDGAGEVVEAGEEVTNLKVGDRILFQGWFENRYATLQQFCVVKAELAAKIPENISFEQAASVPLGLATIILALYNQPPDQPYTLGFKPIWEEGATAEWAGKPALIIGGASSVGQYAIQVAKFAGFSPIITTASPHNTAHLTSLGATHVIDRSLPGDQILARLPELTGRKPIEFIYDAISLPETMALAYQALAPGGALGIVLPDVIPAELKKEGDNKRVSFVLGNVHRPENQECGKEMYKRLTEWLEKGIIKPNPIEVLPNGLASAPEGLARLKSNKGDSYRVLVATNHYRGADMRSNAQTSAATRRQCGDRDQILSGIVQHSFDVGIIHFQAFHRYRISGETPTLGLDSYHRLKSQRLALTTNDRLERNDITRRSLLQLMAAIKTQRALLLPTLGGQYAIGEAPIPSPGPKEVLVKVISAALNPVDWKIASPPGSAIIPRYPFITGTDGAGEVLEIPDNVTYDQAASVPQGLATVILALYNQHPNYPHTLRFAPIWEDGATAECSGKPAFIIGGASSVGQYGEVVNVLIIPNILILRTTIAIQVAKFAEFSPIIATASPHNAAHLNSLGATHVIDRSLSGDQILAELPELTGGKPLEFAYDAISLPDTMTLAYKALAPGGVLALVLPDVIPAELKKDEGKKRVVYVIGNVHMPDTRACGVELYKRLTEWLAKDIIKPNPVEILPNGLAGALEGLECLKNNKVSGKKLIIKPQETCDI
ncbi:hypothetical protein BN946_scf184979.g62 [Trametes cinnabarina]|uniref:Enoyl reductase (ER) domain-containing protein n=1 Tax=Pycnoporus cinnabarinus TaxID=5643 RepID=A0A060SJ24_PYCCI|nr:hypothetical protein BN946_scf184979.g62 [Trametes cinnabarina]